MSSTLAFSDPATAGRRHAGDDQTTAVANFTDNGVLNYVPFDEIILIITATVQILLIAIGLIGVLANGFLMLALVAFKDFRKKTTNIFIGNQTAIDMVACFALATTVLIQKNGTSNYAVGFNRRILCWFFDNTSFLGAALNASKFSLVVIAFERYFKVVHPVKHRNNLRPWMVKLGIITPWMDGLFVIILPMAMTSDVVGGICLSTFDKPGAGMLITATMFASHFVLPLLVFIFCYSNIILVVRRHNKIAGEVNQPRNAVAGPSSGRRPPDAESDTSTTIIKKKSSRRHAKGGASAKDESGDQHLSHAERKVIRTTLTVTACFIICWFPLDFFLVLSWRLKEQVAVTGKTVLTVFAYVNVLLNAMIYSSHLGIITRCWRACRKLCSVDNLPEITLTFRSSRVTPSEKF